MRMRLWPRSIRWQLLAALMLLEVLSTLLFALVLVRWQRSTMHERMLLRLSHQSASLAMQAREALLQNQPGWVSSSVRTAGEAPAVALTKLTNPEGTILFASKGDPDAMKLQPEELARLRELKEHEATVFPLANERWEGASPIYTDGTLRGFAWVENNPSWESDQIRPMVRGIFIFGLIWIASSALLVIVMARGISRPLAVLHRGTRAMMSSPAGGGNFPLPVTTRNEFGDLIDAFNRMVASLEEQRTGLNDTLSLLDSMLANAPIGLAFFDRNCRFVRVNQVFAGMTGVPVSRHLGRTLPELLAHEVAGELESAVQRVMESGEPVRDMELTGQADAQTGGTRASWTWLVSAYPVRTTPPQVRWVGVIVLDASEHKRAEEALRKTEKLAATGRLAASIAHEVNNPLEAITNLLYLLRNYCVLEGPALNYVEMAEREARRIAEITQQTLRFYRQPTLPARATMGEILDSILSLYQVRLNTLGIEVTKEYDPALDLYCFAGEIRQVVANLVGNAMDATAGGGRLVVRARRSMQWDAPGQDGVRITVADTGVGMTPEVRERIFEAFFTTKEVKGTGLGLWVSREIIAKHHGRVHVRSRAGSGSGSGAGRSGTVFQVFLPDHQDLTSQPDEAAAAKA
ncbi:MAG TPA: ATP-binding protein [Terracidiphilus sp.]|nr:ATP-binding protein [Terracidiphilus sp.]